MQYLYLAAIVVELVILFGLSFYAVAAVFSWLKGAPYVPTRDRELNDILTNADLKRGQIFVELGCGDGRVVRNAVNDWHVKGIGVDISWPLIIWARILARLHGIKNVEFLCQDIRKTDLSSADIIYIFLFPKLVEKIREKLLHDTKKPVLIISHGFAIPFFEKNLVKTIKGQPFSTYYYLKTV